MKHLKSIIRSFFLLFKTKSEKQKHTDATKHSPEGKKEASHQQSRINVSYFVERSLRQKKKNTATEMRFNNLSISQEEKSEFIAFQSYYVNEKKSVITSVATDHYKQSQQLTLGVGSGLQPTPAGIVKIIDLYKNY